jgi:hypothetical protein
LAFAVSLSIVPAIASAGGDPQRPCPTTCRQDLLARRTLHAVPIPRTEAPVIDGRLDDPVWARAERATGFVESTPRPGAPASLVSEARVLADDRALYVALVYDDPRPDTIVAPLVRRDDETTSDWAFVEIDSRHDRHSAFSFGVNPRGVQVDGAWVSDTDYDSSWNAVWQAAGALGPHGWTAEFRIPFSQLAFLLPEGGGSLVWGINFYRYSPHHGESSNWSPRYQGLAGVVSNFNDLDVPAPSTVRRIDVTPYVSPRAGDPSGSHVAAGADVRVGLGPNFNLTTTMHPDFGQVEADPSQVNLTAFELFQAERRPFFLEGLDVFRFDTSASFTTRDVDFANDTAFYSRRVGRAPSFDPPDGARLARPPAATTILGAAKLSGQTSRGWTVGAFTAATDGARTLLEGPAGTPTDIAVEAPMLTSVARVRKAIDRAGSSIGVFVADVHRFAPTADVAAEHVRDQLVLGTDATVRFDDARYELGAWALASRSSGTPGAIDRLLTGSAHLYQRPDAPWTFNDQRTAIGGAAGSASLGRVAGAFQWRARIRGLSPAFDLNEIGFQSTADWVVASGTWRYDRFHDGAHVRHWTIGSDNVGAAWTWAGVPRTKVASVYGLIDWANYWMTRLTATHETASLSTSWLRGGPAIRLPARDTLALSMVSDRRHPSFVSVDLSAARDERLDGSAISVSPRLNVRMSDRVQWSVGPSYEVDRVPWQPAGAIVVDGAPVWTVARLTEHTISVTTRAEMVVSPRLSVQFYAQPFATAGRFDRPGAVRAPRAEDVATRVVHLAIDDPLVESMTLAPSEARHLNATAVLRWEYRAGSFVTIVWNQTRGASTSSLGEAGAALGRVFGDPATNVLVLKVSVRL